MPYKTREAKSANSRAYYAAHPEPPAAYRAGHRAEQSAHNAARGPVDPALKREYGLRSRYGLTNADYDRMAESQGGRCAVCGGDNGGRLLVVDHSHVTDGVRGLLCTSCNVQLGVIEGPRFFSLMAYAARNN